MIERCNATHHQRPLEPALSKSHPRGILPENQRGQAAEDKFPDKLSWPEIPNNFEILVATSSLGLETFQLGPIITQGRLLFGRPRLEKVVKSRQERLSHRLSLTGTCLHLAKVLTFDLRGGVSGLSSLAIHTDATRSLLEDPRIPVPTVNTP